MTARPGRRVRAQCSGVLRLVRRQRRLRRGAPPATRRPRCWGCSARRRPHRRPAGGGRRGRGGAALRRRCSTALYSQTRVAPAGRGAGSRRRRQRGTGRRHVHALQHRRLHQRRRRRSRPSTASTTRCRATSASYGGLADVLQASAPIFGPLLAWGEAGCAVWPAPPTRPVGPVAAPGAPPILVVGTTDDPATPYAWAVSVAKELDRGVLLTHDGDDHVAYFYSACVRADVQSYLLERRRRRRRAPHLYARDAADARRSSCAREAVGPASHRQHGESRWPVETHGDAGRLRRRQRRPRAHSRGRGGQHADQWPWRWRGPSRPGPCPCRVVATTPGAVRPPSAPTRGPVEPAPRRAHRAARTVPSGARLPGASRPGASPAWPPARRSPSRGTWSHR